MIAHHSRPFLIQTVGKTPASLLTLMANLGIFGNFKDSQKPQNNLLWAYFETANVKPRAGREVFLSILRSHHFIFLPAVA